VDRPAARSPETAAAVSAAISSPDRRPPRYANPGLEIDGVERDFHDGQYGPTLVNDFAIDFVTRHKDHPFLLDYSLMLTHDPFQPTPDSTDWNAQARGEKTGHDPAHFGAMVEYMDKLIGMLVGRLDELGIRENTLLVFLGDNGTAPAIASRFDGAEYRGGKGSTTLRGTHVPLIVNWPARGGAGAVCADLVGAVDVFPTVCDAAGVPVPDGADGTSFLPQVRGEPGTPRDWIYSWYSPRLGADRKVVEYAFDRRFKLYRSGEFFDLAADPDERHPLPRTELPPRAAEAARTLSAALDRFATARPPGLDEAGRRSDRGPKLADE
jgi:arylsulfatase A